MRSLSVMALLPAVVAAGSSCYFLDSLLPDRGPPSNMRVWRAASAATAGPLAYDGERVYAESRDNRATALARNGKTVWSVAVDQGSVTTDLSLAGCGLVPDAVVCGNNGDLVALNRQDGAMRWRYRANLGGLVGRQPFAVVDSTIYAATWLGGVVHAVDVKSGMTRWTGAIPGLELHGAARTPAADTGIVAVTYTTGGKPRDGGVVAFDAKTGATRWRTLIPRVPPDSDVGGTHAILWRDLVVVSANSGRIFGMDRVTGAIRWSLPGVGKSPPNAILPNRPVLFDYRAMVTIGSTLYASSAPGWFVAYDLETAKELWRVYPETADCDGNPIRTDGRSIYVPYLQGAVVVFAPDGKVRSIAGKNELLGPVTLADGAFFVGGTNGIYAFLKR